MKLDDVTNKTSQNSDEVTLLLNVLREGKQLMQFKESLTDLFDLLTRVSSLNTTLSTNERGCSMEELDKVSEIITGSPSSKTVMEETAQMMKEGITVFEKLVKSGTESLNLFYSKYLEYTDCLDKKYQAALENKKITTFAESYPSFDVDDTTKLPCNDLKIEQGSRRVDECISQYNEYSQTFDTTMKKFLEDVKTFDRSDAGKFCSFFSSSVESLHDAGIILLKYRNWVINELSK